MPLLVSCCSSIYSCIQSRQGSADLRGSLNWRSPVRNSVAAAMPLDRVCYPHCIIPRRGPKAPSTLVAYSDAMCFHITDRKRACKDSSYYSNVTSCVFAILPTLIYYHAKNCINWMNLGPIIVIHSFRMSVFLISSCKS